MQQAAMAKDHKNLTQLQKETKSLKDELYTKENLWLEIEEKLQGMN